MWLFCTSSKISKKTRTFVGEGLGQERNSASLPRDGLAGAGGAIMIMMIRMMSTMMMMMMVMTWRCHGHCVSNRAKLAKVLCGAHDSKEKGLYSGYLRTQSACEKVFSHFVSFFINILIVINPWWHKVHVKRSSWPCDLVIMIRID